MNTATPRIRSQAFLPRKLITDPAVLKIKLTIAPIRPGSIPAIFFPSSLSPFPTPVATVLSPFVSELTITPITVPTARNTAVTVNPYFLKMFLTFSLSESLSSKIFGKGQSGGFLIPQDKINELIKYKDLLTKKTERTDCFSHSYRRSTSR